MLSAALDSLTTNSPKGLLVYYDAIVAVLAIAANCLVLVAVTHGRFFGQKLFYRYFLTSLASADLYASSINVIAMSYHVYAAAPGSMTVPCAANVLRALQLCGFFTNLANLCAMSIDHFFSVIYPVKYRNVMTPRFAKFAILSTWVLAFTVAFLDIPINILLYHGLTTGGTSSAASQFSGSVDASDSYFPDIMPDDENELTMDSLPMQRLLADIAKDEALLTKKLSTSTVAPLLAKLNRTVGQVKRTKKKIIQTRDTATIMSKMLKPSAQDLLLSSSSTQATSSQLRSSNDSAHILDSFFSRLRNDEQQQTNVCTFFSVKKMWFELCIIGFVLACFVLLTFCYSAIFRKVSQRFDSSSSRRTRHFIRTTLIFIGAFAVCWLPFMAFEFSMFLVFGNGEMKITNNYNPNLEKGSTGPGSESAASKVIGRIFMVQAVFSSLMQSYQLLDPLIYAARVPAVQVFISKLLLRCMPCLPCVVALQHKVLRSGSTLSNANLMRMSSINSMAGNAAQRALQMMASVDAKSELNSQDDAQFRSSIISSNTGPRNFS